MAEPLERARRCDEWLEGLPCWACEESLDDEAALCKGRRAESCGPSGSRDLAFLWNSSEDSAARAGISCSILAMPSEHDPRNLLGSVRVTLSSPNLAEAPHASA